MVINLSNSSSNNTNNSPEDILALQKETLQTVAEYLGNLIPAMNTVKSELAGELKEDTWEYLRMIVDGFNWVVTALNGTLDLIGDSIDVKAIDSSVKKFGDAYVAKNAPELVKSIETDIIPFLENLKEISSKY